MFPGKSFIAQRKWRFYIRIIDISSHVCAERHLLDLKDEKQVQKINKILTKVCGGILKLNFKNFKDILRHVLRPPTVTSSVY